MEKRRGLDIPKIKLGKKAQGTISMPFGMIFSIILIIFFIVIAFKGVQYFLDLSKKSEINLFYDKFGEEVKSVFNSQTSSKTFEVNLPSGIEKVCFGNFSNRITNRADYEIIIEDPKSNENDNVFLIPPSKTAGLPSRTIEYIDLANTTKLRNPYCVDVRSGIKLSKGNYDRYVLIR